MDDANIIPLGEDAEQVKRSRKERIVMVDGRGTGYGGAVPMLAENMSATAAVPIAAARAKTRQWDHFKFCGFCGKSKLSETMSRCAHCPRVFHGHCMQENDLQRSAGMFVCPHHKCAHCYRNTASAGGMLFRCTGCLTAYCEDCLPQDEIESLGRCRDLEELGYDSKQSYYISCPACCVADNVRASGIDGDAKSAGAGTQPEGEDGAETVLDREEDPGQKPQSQGMRMRWEEEPDSEDERQARRLQKQQARKAAKERKKEAQRAEQRRLEREKQAANQARTSKRSLSSSPSLSRSRKTSVEALETPGSHSLKTGREASPLHSPSRSHSTSRPLKSQSAPKDSAASSSAKSPSVPSPWTDIPLGRRSLRLSGIGLVEDDDLLRARVPSLETVGSSEASRKRRAGNGNDSQGDHEDDSGIFTGNMRKRNARR